MNVPFSAELKIATVKRRIYQTMRRTKKNDWDMFLPKITKHINETPTKLIGNLRPSDVRFQAGDSIIIERLKELNLFKEPLSIEDQRVTMENYIKDRKNRNFQEGSFVAMETQKVAESVAEKGFAIKSEFFCYFYEVNGQI
jgi:hypothetical protein